MNAQARDHVMLLSPCQFLTLTKVDKHAVNVTGLNMPKMELNREHFALSHAVQ